MLILVNYTRSHVTLMRNNKEEKVSWGKILDMLNTGEDIIGLSLRGNSSIVDDTGRTLWCMGWYK